MKRLILFSAFVLCFVQKSVLGQKYSMERQCQECIQSNQEWFVMPNCTAHCGNAVNWWRRVKANFTGDEVQTISDCSDPILDCKVIDGIVNPSFEAKAEVFGWELTPKESLCKQGINSCTSPSFEGENYLWLCGYTENCKSSVSQDNILFPRDATHLSLYVMPQFGNTNSALDVLIDDVFVFKLSSVQGISTSIDKYVPLDIYIKPYADGGRHKITFSFTEFYEQSIPGTVLIDYARFTKISGLTEGSHPMRGDRCSEQCLSQHINDGRCHTECDNFMCSYSGGECFDEYSDEKCFNGKDPAPMDQFSVCKNYEESTCCSSEEAAAVAERFLPLVKDTTITQKCYNRLQALFCAPCSGKNIGYIRNGKVTYCNDFAIE